MITLRCRVLGAPGSLREEHLNTHSTQHLIEVSFSLLPFFAPLYCNLFSLSMTHLTLKEKELLYSKLQMKTYYHRKSGSLYISCIEM